MAQRQYKIKYYHVPTKKVFPLRGTFPSEREALEELADGGFDGYSGRDFIFFLVWRRLPEWEML